MGKKNKERLCLYISTEQSKQLRIVAEKEGRSLSNMARLILEKTLKNYEVLKNG